MISWWNGLSGREKLMILTAGALSLGFVLWFLVIVPMTEAKASAEREYQRMSADAIQVYSGLDDLQRRSGPARGPVSASNESFELLLSRTASARGLDIVRLQPSGQQELTVWFEEANPQTLMSWLMDLDRSNAISVVRADLRKRNNTNSLRGNVELLREVAQ